MNKLLSALLTGIFAATLSMGAMAADTAKPADLKQSEAASAATSTPAPDAKAPAKAAHKSHKKHEATKAK